MIVPYHFALGRQCLGLNQPRNTTPEVFSSAALRSSLDKQAACQPRLICLVSKDFLGSRFQRSFLETETKEYR